MQDITHFIPDYDPDEDYNRPHPDTPKPPQPEDTRPVVKLDPQFYAVHDAYNLWMDTRQAWRQEPAGATKDMLHDFMSTLDCDLQLVINGLSDTALDTARRMYKNWGIEIVFAQAVKQAMQDVLNRRFMQTRKQQDYRQINWHGNYKVVR